MVYEWLVLPGQLLLHSRIENKHSCLISVAQMVMIFMGLYICSVLVKNVITTASGYSWDGTSLVMQMAFELDLNLMLMLFA